VTIDGRAITEDAQDGWQYDTTNHTIHLSKSQISPPGALIEVRYKALCW